MDTSAAVLRLEPQAILDSLSHGVYVTDVDRRIVYWSRTAEKITGWQRDDIEGKRCCDDILCHVDKDGHRLCGEEYCPLHRAIVTNQASDVPIIVYAQSKSGRRLPVHVSVAPVHDADGRVIGGVESFRALAAEFQDFERARKIQAAALGPAMPEDPRVRFVTRYVPRDIVGGDCYRIARLDDQRYGFMMADVSGHGLAGALYTMVLVSQAERDGHLLARPHEFAEAVNAHLCGVAAGEAFATAVCGVLDLADRTVTFACAGGPLPLRVRGKEFLSVGGPGLPWGMLDSASYEEHVVELSPGDRLLLFTDGAVEIRTAAGDRHLDLAGLVDVLQKLGYPGNEINFAATEQELLTRSNRIRFDDDVTFLEMHLT